MVEFVFTVFDESVGPTPYFYTPDIDLEKAKAIALKSMLVTTTVDSNWSGKTLESIVTAPEYGNTILIYFFTLPDISRRGNVCPVSFSYVLSSMSHPDVFRVAGRASSLSKALSQSISSFFDTQSGQVDINELEGRLTTLLPQLELSKDKQLKVNGRKREIKDASCLATLFEEEVKELDALVAELLVHNPVAVVGADREVVERVIDELITFAPHFNLEIRQWSDGPLPKADIIGTTPEFIDELAEVDMCRLNINRRKVYGGRNNRFCQCLLSEVGRVKPEQRKELVNSRLLWLLENAVQFVEMTMSDDQLGALREQTQSLDPDLVYLLQSIAERTFKGLMDLRLANEPLYALTNNRPNNSVGGQA